MRLALTAIIANDTAGSSFQKSGSISSDFARLKPFTVTSAGFGIVIPKPFTLFFLDSKSRIVC